MGKSKILLSGCTPNGLIFHTNKWHDESIGRKFVIIDQSLVELEEREKILTSRRKRTCKQIFYTSWNNADELYCIVRATNMSAWVMITVSCVYRLLLCAINFFLLNLFSVHKLNLSNTLCCIWDTTISHLLFLLQAIMDATRVEPLLAAHVPNELPFISVQVTPQTQIPNLSAFPRTSGAKP